jgi:hypothetical protein
VDQSNLEVLEDRCLQYHLLVQQVLEDQSNLEDPEDLHYPADQLILVGPEVLPVLVVLADPALQMTRPSVY